MSRAARRWILFCLALLPTAGASYLEFESLNAAWTAGDVVEHPSYSEQQYQRDVRALRHEANVYTAEAVVCVVLASLSLGTAFRRRGSKYSILVYIAAFVVCPFMAVLPIYILIRLHTP